MSNRLIKEGYLTSMRINACSTGAQNLWLRLALSADDYGLFEASPVMVTSLCYPSGIAPAREEVERYLDELEEHELIIRYRDVTERRFLIMVRWYVLQVRQVQPLYPPPPEGVIRLAQGVVKLLDWVRNTVVKKQRKGLQGVRSKQHRGHDEVLVGDPGKLPSGTFASDLHAKSLSDLDQKSHSDLPTKSHSNLEVAKRPLVEVAQRPQGEVAMPRSLPRAHARLRSLDQGEVLNPTATSTASRVRVNGEEAAEAAAKKRVTFNLETRQFDGLQEATLLRWQDMYPDVPIGAELERAAAWIEVNEPQQLRADYERFLLGWVSDANTKRARSPSRGHT